MLVLQIPCRVTNKEQLNAKLALLEQYQGSGYQLGIEIVGKYWDDFFSPQNVEDMKKILGCLPKSVYLSLHAPYERKDWGKNFFGSDGGFSSLLHIFDLADRCGISLINIHASLFHTNDDLRKAAAGNLEKHKSELINRVATTLNEIHLRYPQQKICLENMPYCIDYDLVLDPKDMVYEVCFVELDDFFKIIDFQKNILATVDTCHLAAVYDSSQLLGQIKKLGSGLGHVHLTDLRGSWQPFIALGQEGVVPGEGRIGERVFKELLQYFWDFSQKQDLSIVLEINDEDLVKLKNLKTTFKRVVNWLNELKQGR